MGCDLESGFTAFDRVIIYGDFPFLKYFFGFTEHGKMASYGVGVFESFAFCYDGVAGYFGVDCVEEGQSFCCVSGDMVVGDDYVLVVFVKEFFVPLCKVGAYSTVSYDCASCNSDVFTGQTILIL